MKRFTRIMLLISIFLSINAYAQEDIDSLLQSSPNVAKDTVIAFHSNLHALSRYTGDSVILRWSPDQPGGWHVGNQIGYVIERTEIGSDSIYNPGDFRSLNTDPIKPWPLDDWQKIAGEGKSQYAAIAAQSLYGEGYTSTGLFDQADEFKNRFSFALLAADFSPETAEALGLRFVDKNVEKNKVYIYRIMLARPSANYTIDTAYHVVNTSGVDKLPEVVPGDIIENELKVTFYWDRTLYDQYYSAYYIERSEDGKDFKRLNKTPYVNALSNDFKANQNIIIYSDSVAPNYKPYYYRFIGLSPFGELSKPSTPIKAMGKDRTPPGPPEQISTKALSGSSVMITWAKQTEESDMAGYIVSRSQDFGGNFVPLFNTPLKPSMKSYIDKSAVEHGTNYYKVSALDTAGNISSSLISYAMITDSIPPAKPQNLIGTIDSTGLVTLKWSLGNEPNLKGYNIYFANAKGHVFTTLNNHPIQDTVFYDTIQVKTLTEEIFYCLKAVNVNFSLSETSDTLRLQRPDIIPPTQPVITSYKVEKDGIILHWQNSSSKDAAKYVLYRSEENHVFKEIGRFLVGDAISMFRDFNVESGRLYTYRLVTIDDAGLHSDMSFPVSLKARYKEEEPTVTNLKVKKDADKNLAILSWSYQHPAVNEYVIYRAVDGKHFRTYKTLGSSTKIFEDSFIKPGSQYEYTIKVKFKNGRTTDFGKIVSLTH